MRDYNSQEFKTFRQEVKYRDNYQCCWPNCTAKRKLQVHHILPWSQHLELRYMLSNGITLCKTHHKLVTGNEYIYSCMLSKIVNG